MDYQNFFNFFSSRSLPSIIIAIIIAILTFIVDRFLLNKISKSIKIYAPFLLGIILYFIYDLIFVKSHPIFSINTLSLGFTAGTLSMVLLAILKRIFKKNGLHKIDLSPIGLLIESIIYPLISEPELKLAVLSIEKLLNIADNLSGDDKVVSDIVSVLDSHTNSSIPENELCEVAKLIVKAKQTLSAN